MTDLRDFEDDLRAMLTDAEADANPRPGLAGRLTAGVTAPRALERHRVDLRARRWLPPLLAAAAVAAVAVGSFAIVNSTHADGPARPGTHLPTLPAPRPTTHGALPVPAPTSRPEPGVPTGSPLPAGFAAHDVQFRDSAHGYAIGNVPCSSAPHFCAAIARTQDGGLTWVALSTPKGIVPVEDRGNVSGGSCGTNGNIYGPCVNQILFADAQHGYLWSHHSFYFTDDGGATWRDGKSRADYVVAAGGEVVRARVLHDCSSPCAYRIERAKIGSTTWQDVTPGGQQVYQALVLSAGDRLYLQAFKKVTFTSADQPTLFRSSDDGATWTTVPLDNCGVGPASTALDGSIVGICGASNQTVRVMGADETTFGPPHATPYRPVDPNSSASLEVMPRSQSELIAFLQADSTTPGPWTAYVSHDGGATWSGFGAVAPWTQVTTTFGYLLGTGNPPTSSIPNLQPAFETTSDGGRSFVPHRF